MKKFKLITLLFLSLTLTYCSSDDESSEEQQQQNNEQENVILNADLVSNGILIDGATKINGNAPQPNNAISFSLNNTSSALLSEGYDINFQSTNDVAGAYLVFSDVDGNSASSYYDVPASAFEFLIEEESDKAPFSKSRKMGGDLNINVGFNNTVPAGRFCYTICVYDDNGNISAPQTVCITVESWGGNSNLVANWQLIRYQETYNNVNNDIGLNEEYCYPETLYCNNGSTLNFESCYTWEDFTMTLNSNGTYTLFIKEKDSYIDYDASSNSCTIIYEPDTNYEYTSEGYWAYNDSDQKLVMAEYAYSYNENGTTDEGNYGTGNAQIIFDDTISINGNTFTMTFDYGDNDIEIYTFQK